MCSEVLVQAAAADQTQELVNGDECLEPPPRTSTPVPGHDVDISETSLDTTEILLREHSYSRIGSVSFSEPQSTRSVSGYHSLSVSEAEGAAADLTRDRPPQQAWDCGLHGLSVGLMCDQSEPEPSDGSSQSDARIFLGRR